MEMPTEFEYLDEPEKIWHFCLCFSSLTVLRRPAQRSQQTNTGSLPVTFGFFHGLVSRRRWRHGVEAL
jgi:hypothetical protein